MSRPRTWCTVPGCPRVHLANGFCVPHYRRWRIYGDPLAGRPPTWLSPLEYVIAWSKRMPNGCREWQGRLHLGYGRVTIGGARRMAHVVTFEAVRGPVPEGLVLDHLICDNRACNDEWHVEPATHRENILRGNGAAAVALRRKLAR